MNEYIKYEISSVTASRINVRYFKSDNNIPLDLSKLGSNIAFWLVVSSITYKLREFEIDDRAIHVIITEALHHSVRQIYKSIDWKHYGDDYLARCILSAHNSYISNFIAGLIDTYHISSAHIYADLKDIKMKLNTTYPDLVDKIMREKELSLELLEFAKCRITSNFEVDYPRMSSLYIFYLDHCSSLNSTEILSKFKDTSSLQKKSIARTIDQDIKEFIAKTDSYYSEIKEKEDYKIFAHLFILSKILQPASTSLRKKGIILNNDYISAADDLKYRYDHVITERVNNPSYAWDLEINLPNDIKWQKIVKANLNLDRMDNIKDMLPGMYEEDSRLYNFIRSRIYDLLCKIPLRSRHFKSKFIEKEYAKITHIYFSKKENRDKSMYQFWVEERRLHLLDVYFYIYLNKGKKPSAETIFSLIDEYYQGTAIDRFSGKSTNGNSNEISKPSTLFRFIREELIQALSRDLQFGFAYCSSLLLVGELPNNEASRKNPDSN